jgi:phosphate starvation-inducible PhoH-like protein
MRKKQTKQKSQKQTEVTIEVTFEPVVKLLKPQSHNQSLLIQATHTSNIVFAAGPAGTGKTYVAVSRALDMLQAGIIQQIILTRPKIPAGEDYGHLPGTLEEKMAPYLAPYKQVIIDRIGKQGLIKMLEDGRIMAVPVGFLQGLTFNNAVILVDEAENATLIQLRLILTRLGYGSSCFLMGDERQTYINNSGFLQVIKLLKLVPIVKTVWFTIDDVVRSEACRLVLEAFETLEKL